MSLGDPARYHRQSADARRPPQSRIAYGRRGAGILAATVVVGLSVGAAGTLVAQDYLQQRSNVAVQRAGNSSGVSSKNNGPQSAAAMIRKAGQLQYPANGTIGDWVLRCATPAQCSISQKFSQAPSSAVIVWLELAKNPTNPSAFLATVMTPLGFNLSPPLAFHGDDAVAFRVMVDRCVSSGCIHMASLTRETALGLARHAALRARYVDAQGRALDVMLSTKGLNEALLALDSLANP